MIAMNIPMPKNCAECPCSYLVRTGEYEGCTMCNALEFKEPNHSKGYYLVDESAKVRPVRCVMTEVVVRYDPR